MTLIKAPRKHVNRSGKYDGFSQGHRMKAVIVLFLLTVVVVASAQAQSYQSKYGNIDVDAILKNPRVVKSYVNCFLDEGPCTPQGREGKSKWFVISLA